MLPRRGVQHSYAVSVGLMVHEMLKSRRCICCYDGIFGHGFDSRQVHSILWSLVYINGLVILLFLFLIFERATYINESRVFYIQLLNVSSFI